MGGIEFFPLEMEFGRLRVRKIWRRLPASAVATAAAAATECFRSIVRRRIFGQDALYHVIGDQSPPVLRGPGERRWD